MRTAFTALDNVCPGKEFISTETSLQDNNGSLGGSPEGQAKGLIKMYSILFDMRRKAREFAIRNNKPYLPDSDAHQPQDFGISYIEFENSLLDESNEERLLLSLRAIIRRNLFNR